MREAFGPETFDDRLVRSFWNHARYFIDRLGNPERDRNELRFPVQDLPFIGFTIRCVAEKKFLGRIYVMILEGLCPAADLPGPGEGLELRYSGFMRKKEPFFASIDAGEEPGSGRKLMHRLNRDSLLLRACQDLEVESLNMVVDPQERIWKIRVRPFGGSYVHLLFPPMRYPVLLPHGQAEILFSVMHQIACHIAPSGDRKREGEDSGKRQEV